MSRPLRALAWTSFGLLILLVSIPAIVAWLLGSESGNGFLLARLPGLLGAQISVGERHGSVAGALEWKDIVYEDDGIRVGVRRVALAWKPEWLLDRRVSIESLKVDGVDVRLKDKPDEPPKPESNQPPLSRLPVSIEIESLVLSDFQLWTVGAGQPTVIVPNAAFVGSWIGRDVKITNLSADYAPIGKAQLSGQARLSGEGVEIAALEVSAPAALSAKGFVGYQKASDLALSWRDLRWPLQAVDPQAPPLVTSSEGQATLKGTWDDLQFTLATALGSSAKIQGEGRWNGALDAQLSWTKLGWPLVEAQASEAKIVESARGKLAFKGMPEHYEFDLDADLLAQKQSGVMQARGSGSTESVDLSLLRLTVGKAVLEAAGPLTWAPKPAGSLKGRIAHFDPGLFAAEWPGDINGEFEINGDPAPGQLPAVRFKLGLHDSKLRNYPLKLDGEGQYVDEVLQIARLDVQSGGSQLSASGRASAPYDIQAQLVSLKLQELAPRLAGSAQVTASFKGTVEKPHLVAEADVARAAFGDYAVKSAELTADLDWNGPLTLDLKTTGLAVGVAIDELTLTGRGTRGEHTLKLDADSREGQVGIELAGGYDDKKQRWQGQLAQGRIAPAALAPWTLQAPAALSLSAQQNEIGQACWTSDPGRVCLQAKQAPATTSAEVQIEQLAFAYFKTVLPQDLHLDGALSGNAAVELADGQIRQARAEINTTEGSAGYGDQRMGFKPARLLVTDGAEGRIELRLPLDVGGIEADAQLAPNAVMSDRALSGEVRLDFPDLAFLSVLSPEIGGASGRLDGRYQLAGRVGAPELHGEAQLSDGRIKLTRPGIELTDVTARVAGSPGGRLSVDARAKSGEGELTIQGQVENAHETTVLVEQPKPENAATALENVATATPPDAPAEPPPAEPGSVDAELPKKAEPGGIRLKLAIKGENFLAANLPTARAWISPDLTFEMGNQQARLKGTLGVPRAEVKLANVEDSGTAPSGDQIIVNAAGEAPDPVQGLKLFAEVKVVLGNKVSLEGFGLKTRIEGDVTAVEEPGRDTLGYGELRLVDGRYKAYGQDLTIETGKLLFNGGPIAKPGLEIRAFREIQQAAQDQIKVGIYVRGTLEKPQLSLYSEPTMTQQQQLSWLLFGRPLDQSSSSEDRSMLSGAAVALGLGGGSALAQNLRGGLGVDEISLGSSPGETQEQARLTVGKYLSPKLFVSYGIGLFQPGNVFKLLYDLGKGFKISTESGTFTGGDLLYTIERR